MRLSKTETLVAAGFVLGGCLIVAMSVLGIYLLNSEEEPVAEAITPPPAATSVPPPPAITPTEPPATPTLPDVPPVAGTPTATRVLEAGVMLDPAQSLESYSREVLRLSGEYLDNLDQLWQRQDEAMRNVALLDDPAWQAETTALFDELRAANAELSSIQVPPDASEFHDKLRSLFHSCMSGTSRISQVADGIDSYADLGSAYRAMEQVNDCLLYASAIDPDLELGRLTGDLSPACISSIDDYLAQVSPLLAEFHQIMNQEYRDEPLSPAAIAASEQRLGHIQAQVEAVPTPECGAQSADNIRSIVQLGAGTYVQAVTHPEDESVIDPLIVSSAATLSEDLLRRIANGG